MGAGQELGPDSRIAERLEFGGLGETTARVAGATIDLGPLVQLGHAYHEDGDHRRALERSREALDMARRRGVRLVEARPLHLAYLLDPVHPDGCATRAHEILEQTGAAQLDILPPPA